MRTRTAALAGVLVVALGVAAGCGGGDDTAATTPTNAATITVTAGSLEEAQAEAIDQMRSEFNQQIEEGMEGTRPDLDLTGLEDFPREIPTTAIPENMRSHVETAGGRTDVIVEIGPHIYAIRGHGEVGEITDYTTVFGLCVDINQFERRTGLSLGNSCW